MGFISNVLALSSRPHIVANHAMLVIVYFDLADSERIIILQADVENYELYRKNSFLDDIADLFQISDVLRE